MRIRGRSTRKAESPFPGSRWRLAPIAGLVLAASLTSGCRAVREASDRGQRILEAPGLRPAKLFAVAGAVPGCAAGVPLTILGLPTIPFEGLQYPSSPAHDISMPVLFAPLDYGIGLGAFVFSSPFLLFNPDLGSPGEPSEWPPARESPSGKSPGLSSARTVEMVYPPTAPPNPPPLETREKAEAQPEKAAPPSPPPPPPPSPEPGKKD